MTTPLLERLLNCKESANFIIIEDSIMQSGYILLKEFIKKIAMNQKQGVLLLCLEFSPEWLLENSPKNLVIFDAYSKLDSYDFENDLEITSISSDLNYHFIKNFNNLSEIVNIIKDTIKKLSYSNYTLIIDSISPLLLISASLTINFLKKISSCLTLSDANTNNLNIITVYHSDIPNYPTSGISGYLNVRNTLLHYMASTTIIVKNTEQFRKESTSHGYITMENNAIINAQMNLPESSICIIEHRKKSGKVLYETNSYHIDESSGNMIFRLVKDVKDDLDSVDSPDPTTANLLFNLSLTETQKKAKNDLVLPYVKIQDQYEEKNRESVTTSGGNIFYEPDKDDDFDEEDPDDDLSI